MGGGDLNMKKSWHPGLLKNRAKVWEDQNVALQERKRIEALKKEIEAERAANELQRLNEANGGPKRQERVEFLYSGPGGSSGMMEDREAYLLGRKRIDDVLGKDTLGQDLGSKNAKSQAPGSGVNLRDVAHKVAMDPLLAIKKQEAAHLASLVNKRKAEHELEARRAARKEARSSNDRNKLSSSRHRTDRHSSRRYDDYDDDERKRRRHRSPHGGYDAASYSSSRHDRERQSDRDYQSKRDHRTSPSEKRRYRSRSCSLSAHRNDERREYPRRRSRSPIKEHHGDSWFIDDAHRHNSSFRSDAEQLARDEAARAAALAEMTGAAIDLDNLRAKRLEESRIQDQNEQAAENSLRS